MQLVIVDTDGTERAVNRITYGSRLHVDEGDTVKRGQRLAEWDPYTRPVLTEVDGFVGFEDLVDRISVIETADESTGITKRVVIDWRANPRGGDLKPAIVVKGKDGKVKKTPRGTRCPLPAFGRRHPVGRAGRRGEGRRRARPYPDGERQDPRHHGRSAARGGAVRGASSEGSRHHRRDRRHDPLRPRLQEQAPDHPRAARGGRRGGRVPDPEGQAVPSPGRRHRREGRLHRRRQPGAARHPGDQGDRGARRVSRQRDPGRLPAAGRDDQRQAHRGDRPSDAAEGRDHRPGRHRHVPGRADRPARPRHRSTTR